MAKQKKQIEYRYYEIPEGHYVMALLGDSWVRSYGAEQENLLHFHNYMEIGYCYWGNGQLTIEEANVNYKGGIIHTRPKVSTMESVNGSTCTSILTASLRRRCSSSACFLRK